MRLLNLLLFKLVLRADSLRQIMRIIYTDRPTGRVEKRSLFRLLGEVQIVQKYLLPLLIAYRDDPVVAFDVGTSVECVMDCVRFYFLFL